MEVTPAEKPTCVAMEAHDMGFDAHLTVHYLGDDVPDEKLYEIRDTLEQSKYQGILYVLRKSIKMFGPYGNIPVVTVSVPRELKNLNRRLQEIYPTPSEYIWNPHITLDQNAETIRIPTAIRLDKIGLY